MYGAMDFENSKQSRALVTFLAVARYPPPSFRSGQSNRPLHLSLQSVNTGSVQFAASSRAVQEKDDIVPRDTIQVRIPPWRPLSHQSMLLTAVWCLVRVYLKGRRAYKGRQAKACKNSVRGRGCRYCAVVRFTCATLYGCTQHRYNVSHAHAVLNRENLFELFYILGNEMNCCFRPHIGIGKESNQQVWFGLKLQSFPSIPFRDTKMIHADRS